MKTKQLVVIMAILMLTLTPTLAAIDLTKGPSSKDKATFDKIAEPLVKVYNFIKYIATAIAALVLVGAGIVFMFSGNDPRKRDQAKSMVMYVVFGLIIIWVAPLVVSFLVT